MSQDIEELQAALRLFAEERDWGQFHSPKNLAVSLSIEAAEVLRSINTDSEMSSPAIGSAPNAPPAADGTAAKMW